VADIIKISIGGQESDALFGATQAPGRHPAILIAHHQEGLSPFTRDLVDKLAACGYVAICPDHYHRCRPEDDLDTRRNSLRDPAVLGELGAALDFLKAHPKVRADRIAVIGHCMGGRAAFLAAGSLSGFAAAVIFYPTGMLAKRGENCVAFDRLHKIACPVIAFFGETDRLIPLDHADKIDAELRRCGIPVESHRYANAGHAFCNFGSPTDYRETAAADSWKRAVAFLDRHLKSATGPVAG